MEINKATHLDDAERPICTECLDALRATMPAGYDLGAKAIEPGPLGCWSCEEAAWEAANELHT